MAVAKPHIDNFTTDCIRGRKLSLTAILLWAATMTNILPYLEIPQLPKLNVVEKAKFGSILQTLIAKVEFQIEEMMKQNQTPATKNWIRGQLKYWRHQRASFVWLDKIIGQQKEESVADSGFA